MVLATAGRSSAFYDNGHYVGHDEPSVKFISALPGSGNTMNYAMRLPRDPRKRPTARGTRTDYAELSLAPWFGLPMCDPAFLPAEPVHAGQRHQFRGADQSERRWLGVHGTAVLPAGVHPVHRQRELQQVAVVRGADHRQRRVHLQLRVLQHQLRGAGQLLLPADQRHPARLARAAGPEHQDDARQCKTLKLKPGVTVLKVSMTEPGGRF